MGDGAGMIGIIDYNMGNIQSVLNAFEYIPEPVIVVREPEELSKADSIVLPGVGAFAAGIDSLRKSGLADALNNEVIGRKKPFLGICLGMQLICKESFEFGHHQGLGWIDASVCRFEADLKVRVPHVGWNNLIVRKNSALINKNETELDVYFVHSYYVDSRDPEAVSAVCDYGRRFCAVIEKDNIFATQFHPEKSQSVGLKILRNFCKVKIPCLKGG
jgi:glutamine amidotransferase